VIGLPLISRVLCGENNGRPNRVAIRQRDAPVVIQKWLGNLLQSSHRVNGKYGQELRQHRAGHLEAVPHVV
jgi:hypothetical protein